MNLLNFKVQKTSVSTSKKQKSKATKKQSAVAGTQLCCTLDTQNINFKEGMRRGYAPTKFLHEWSRSEAPLRRKKPPHRKLGMRQGMRWQKKTQNAFRQFYLGMHSDVLQPRYALGRVCVGQGMRRPRYASARVCGNQGMRQPGYAPTMVCAVQGMRQPKYALARLPSILHGSVEE